MDKEIERLEAEVDAVTKELETLTIRLDELKERPPQHLGNYQIGSIPSLGTKSSVTIRDDSDEIIEEDCTVESMKKNEDKDVGTKSYVTILGSSDEVVEEFCSVKSTKKDEDEDVEIDGTFSTLSKLDEEIAAIKIMLETLPAKLEALEKKRAHYVSHLELK
ncbi:uncharacterized protein LOC132303526 isoform X2 [Cornus florida]|nr:uncharacterized protein LOC132303526 isoform X2 [Cornus florida]